MAFRMMPCAEGHSSVVVVSLPHSFSSLRVMRMHDATACAVPRHETRLFSHPSRIVVVFSCQDVQLLCPTLGHCWAGHLTHRLPSAPPRRFCGTRSLDCLQSIHVADKPVRTHVSLRHPRFGLLLACPLRVVQLSRSLSFHVFPPIVKF